MKLSKMTFINWVFGLLFSAIGLVNLFWGNDPEFGVFIILISLIYYPPVQQLIQKRTPFSIPKWILIGLGLFVLWASLGVGELLNKIQIMSHSLF
ncbi:MAG: hypothetical protein RIR67_244, partial [Bacteroidota bacterium]|jgi:hypothetical protein